MARKIKLTKNKIRAIIIAGVTLLVILALIITNIFVPVKYLASYMVLRNKGAKEGVMRVRFVDVGYGDCTIIELPDGKNMVIDCGNGSMSNQSRILKFLNKCNIDVIDWLVCTNVNAEHCGGLAELVGYKKVNKIYMPGPDFVYTTDEYRNFCVASSGTNTVISQYGEGETGDDYDYFFTFISPSRYTNPDSEYQTLLKDTSSLQARNNASAVIWLEYAGTAFLLTSDVSDSVLQTIYENYSFEKDYYNFREHAVRLDNCNVIQVANHGAAGSAYAPFYDLAKPETAVISTNGSQNLNDILSDLTGNGCEKIYRTDEYGTVTIEVTSSGYAVV